MSHLASLARKSDVMSFASRFACGILVLLVTTTTEAQNVTEPSTTSLNDTDIFNTTEWGLNTTEYNATEFHTTDLNSTEFNATEIDFNTTDIDFNVTELNTTEADWNTTEVDLNVTDFNATSIDLSTTEYRSTQWMTTESDKTTTALTTTGEVGSGSGKSGKNDGLSDGELAGLIIGVILGVILLALLVWYLYAACIKKDGERRDTSGHRFVAEQDEEQLLPTHAPATSGHVQRDTRVGANDEFDDESHSADHNL